MIHLKNPLSVLVINENNGPNECLERSVFIPLREQGFIILETLTTIQDAVNKVHALQPRLIIVNLISPSYADLDNLALIYQQLPCPIIMFSEHSDKQAIDKGLRAGVSCCVVNGLEPHRLMSIIDVAICRFEETQAMRNALSQAQNELEKARAELADRKLIEKAKGLIMKHNHCTEEQAFKAMRKMAMDQQKSLTEIAAALITALN